MTVGIVLRAQGGDRVIRSTFNRRDVLRVAASTGAVAAVSAVGANAAIAAPGARMAGLRTGRQGVTGEITVSYPDELGLKPPFVDQAAETVRTANPDAKVTV